jgi:hypothetical protein
MRVPSGSWQGRPVKMPAKPAAFQWPRLMTPRHPLAVGTYGPAAIQWAEARKLHPRRSKGVRWHQRLILHRALEYDRNGDLVWPLVVISGPRQVGKSWVERIVCGWRIDTGAARWGEQQDVLHVAHKLIAAKEVWFPAAKGWAEHEAGAKVRYANDGPQIELADGSRWMLQAATEGAGVAFALVMALVDEGWRVPRSVYDHGIAPTMAESQSPQSWLVSTAGTSDSDLMLTYRAKALAVIDRRRVKTGDSLLIEWSVPPGDDLDLDDPRVWRLGQPYWDRRREAWLRWYRGQVDERAFLQQALNMWVPSLSPPVLGADVYERVAGEFAPAGGLAFGAQVMPDHSRAVIVAYGGDVAEVIDDREQADWVAGRLAALVEAHGGAIGLVTGGPAGGAADALKKGLGDRLVKMTAAHAAAAAGQVYDDLTSARPATRLRAHPLFRTAVGAARRRKHGTGGAWTWDTDAAGMVMTALSAARWASAHAPEPEPEPEEPAVFV